MMDEYNEVLGSYMWSITVRILSGEIDDETGDRLSKKIFEWEAVARERGIL